ncbi:helix-turn-helix transcriptional regulator [Vibrio rumoiensis]|uniref:Helix-turn-helix transcriptional regulator n=1 Tax=Vibrio rumoiensis TaxID=76258 RepID=A0ABW7IVD9_9VIBR
MNNIFADYIISFRQKHSITQNEIIELLGHYDEQFSKLDITTISRWENRKTVPSLAKQILVVRALGGNASDILSHHCGAPLTNDEYLKPFAVRTTNPYSLSVPSFNVSLSDSLIQESDSLVPESDTLNKIMIFHDNFIKMPIDIHSKIENNKVRLKTIYDYEKNLSGHSLYGFCTIKNLKQHPEMDYITCIDTHMTIDETELQEEHLVMNVLSSYSSTAYAKVINFIKLIQRLNSMPSIKTLIITVQFQEIYNFFDTLQGVRVIEKGKKVKYGGIRFGTQNYSYLRLYVKPEYLLAVKELMTFSVHSDHYLNSLLSK